jgi:hypothetical protein
MTRGNGAGRSTSLVAHAIGTLLGLVLLLSATLAAQMTDTPSESVIRVANTDGAVLNLRSDPTSSASVVSELVEGDLLIVTGPARTADDARWLPVKGPGGASGWVAAQYTALVSAPAPPTVAVATVAPSPEPIVAEAPRAESASIVSVPAERGPPVDIESKLKYPEARTREQEITIWVTRNGTPVPGAIVYIKAEDGDDEVDRVLEPTDADGRTRRVFSVKKDKGTVYLTISAVAPDGGEGNTATSFFRR